MSYIDTFAHEPVGVLAGLPVYRPLVERQAPWGAYDFGCTPNNLVLGGGSGEHPALVVHRFDEMVAAYVAQCVDDDPALFAAAPESREQLEDLLLSRCSYNFEKYFEFCGWGLEQMATLVHRIQSPGNPSPWKPGTESAEHWLTHSLGGFCWHHLPQLAGELVQELRNGFPELASSISPQHRCNVVPLGSMA